MNKLVENLKAARRLIEKPKSWTKKANARDEEGSIIGTTHPSAVCFCAHGAIRKVTYLDDEATWPALDALSTACGMNPIEYNDEPDTTHQDILNMFDKAISNYQELSR